MLPQYKTERMADLIPILKKELAEEAAITRKMFAVIPEDKWDWTPHPKSMPLGKLASHIAEMPAWIALAMTRDGLDFAKGEFKPEYRENKSDLMKFLNNTIETGDSYLRPEFEAVLDKPWVLRSGDMVIREYTKAEVVRMVLNQVTHHRAQLGIYLRLLDIPIPGSYGPSADEH